MYSAQSNVTAALVARMAKSILTMWFITLKMHGGNSVCQVALCTAARLCTAHCQPLYISISRSDVKKNSFSRCYVYWTVHHFDS